VCSTSTGWFGCNKKDKENREAIKVKKEKDGNNAKIEDNTLGLFEQELGLGISIYFKQLKFMVILFALFSIFSIPAFWLFYSGNEAKIKNFYDTKGIFSTFTLGNLGASGQLCKEVNKDFKTTEFQCSFGVMDSLILYAMADN